MIATARGLGEVLPEDARLAVDPYGTRFATRWLRFVVRHARLFAPLVERMLLTVQVRTRVIDDLLLAFLREDGRQVVILGAGYDCRAARFEDRIAQASGRVFEVDHPATQAAKRALVPPPPSVASLAWDFEARDAGALPGALAALGHDAGAPSLTVWEGVTMYLSEAAVDATVRAVAALSAPRSTFVLTYFTPRALRPRGLLDRLARRVVLGKAEPLTFAFVPDAVPAWLQARGFSLALDASLDELARTLLPARYHGLLDGDALHFAVARRD